MSKHITKLMILKEKFAQQAIKCVRKDVITRSRFKEVLGFEYLDGQDGALEYLRQSVEHGTTLEDFQNNIIIRIDKFMELNKNE